MGRCFSKEPIVKIFDEIPKGEQYDYLRPEGTIVYSIDRTYNMPMIQIIFDGWFETSARLWPKDNAARENFLLLERTPSFSPSDYFFPDSGIDTVF